MSEAEKARWFAATLAPEFQQELVAMDWTKATTGTLMGLLVPKFQSRAPISAASTSLAAVQADDEVVRLKGKIKALKGGLRKHHICIRCFAKFERGHVCGRVSPLTLSAVSDP